MLQPQRSEALRLSIVIASWNGKASLQKCLQSLERQDAAEVIVVSNFDGETKALLEERFSRVKYIRMPAGTTVPRLRAEGIRCSTGEIVALAEDHCTFDQHWCAELMKAHQLPYPAIGGAVENTAADRALDWAVYFYDYGRFMLPLEAGPVPALSGNNVSYKRGALQEIEPALRDGVFEPFLHAELARRGHSLYLAPSVVVYHDKHYQPRHAMAQAYHLARSYAARRVSSASVLRRTMFAAGSLALPVLLPARIVLRTLRRRRLLRELSRCFLYLLLLTTSWSAGEFCGYLAGAGKSAAEWK